MSMIVGFGLLSDANINRLLADPPLIWQFLEPDDPTMYERAAAESRPAPGLLQRLFHVQVTPPLPKPLVLTEREGVAPDLDKAWHGLHYLLARTGFDGDPPLNFLVAGGRPVGEVDVGYGPARVYTAAETAVIHRALSALSDDALRSRFDPAAMMKAEIYPAIWDRPVEEDDTLGYLMEGLQTLRGVLATAVEIPTGLVVYLM